MYKIIEKRQASIDGLGQPIGLYMDHDILQGRLTEYDPLENVLT